MTVSPSGGGAAPSPSSAEPGTLFVAFPVTACSGAESAVFLDEEGRFIGAVAPGTAAYLPMRAESKRLFVVGSADVTAPPKTAFLRHEIPRRSDQGVLVEVPGADAHNCSAKWSGPLELRPASATLEATAEKARGATWLAVRTAEGDRWLDEHRARVDELLGRAPVKAKALEPVITSATLP
jgi:hypothetical protein